MVEGTQLGCPQETKIKSSAFLVCFFRAQVSIWITGDHVGLQKSIKVQEKEAISDDSLIYSAHTDDVHLAKNSSKENESSSPVSLGGRRLSRRLYSNGKSEPKADATKGRISSQANINPGKRIQISKALCYLKATYIMGFNDGNKMYSKTRTCLN